MIGTSDGKAYECEMRYNLNIPALPEMMDNEKNLSQSQEQSNEPKKIYFVRHGDTDLNSESSKPTDGNYSTDEPIRGWSDVSLNQEGRKHAQKAAEGIKDLPIEHIVSSDLPRAAETARIIGNKRGIPVEYDPGLRTWDLGAYTEQTGKEVHDAVNRLCMEAQDERPPSSSKYQGESFNEFKDRILGTVSNIIQRHNDKETLLVSHNSPERVLHSWTAAGQPQKQGSRWFPEGDTEEDRVQTAPSHFRERLDPNLQANQYGPTEAEAVGWREMLQRAKRDRTLTIDFPDAFPQSQMQTDLGLDEIGDQDLFTGGLNRAELATRARHKEGDLAGKLGIHDIGAQDEMNKAIDELRRQLDEIKSKRNQ